MDVAHVQTPHSAGNIQTKYHAVLAAYGLNEDNIFKVVSDNTSTMKKAFSFELWEEEEGDDETRLDENKDIGDPEEVQDLDVELGEVFEEAFRLPCSIHTLQLLVKDSIATMS